MLLPLIIRFSSSTIQYASVVNWCTGTIHHILFVIYCYSVTLSCIVVYDLFSGTVFFSNIKYITITIPYWHNIKILSFASYVLSIFVFFLVLWFPDFTNMLSSYCQELNGQTMVMSAIFMLPIDMNTLLMNFEFVLIFNDHDFFFKLWEYTLSIIIIIFFFSTYTSNKILWLVIHIVCPFFLASFKLDIFYCMCNVY